MRFLIYILNFKLNFVIFSISKAQKPHEEYKINLFYKVKKNSSYISEQNWKARFRAFLTLKLKNFLYLGKKTIDVSYVDCSKIILFGCTFLSFSSWSGHCLDFLSLTFHFCRLHISELPDPFPRPLRWVYYIYGVHHRDSGGAYIMYRTIGIMWSPWFAYFRDLHRKT